MRILHVISGIEPENGGPTAALTGQCRALVAAGAKVSIVATWKLQSSFALAEQLRNDGIDVTLLGPTKPPFRGHPDLDKTLAAAIAGHDVVHIHAMWEAIEHRAAVLARKANKPYVWTPHGMLDEWNMRRNHWFKRTVLAAYLRRDLKRASAINVATDFEARQVSRHKLGTPFIIEGFGLDETLLGATPNAIEFRSRHHLVDDARVILFLGRIQHGKGLELLIPALARLTIPVHLVVAGPDEGDYKQKIDALVQSHRLTSRVHFVGMIKGDEKLQALAAADVLAAPSQHENFGIAVAEAIALGTPVVVSDQVGLADAIRQHHLGHVAPLTVDATAAALDAALSNPSPNRDAARAYAREHFTWPSIAARWLREYARLVPSPLAGEG